jgi:hypothetical protein
VRRAIPLLTIALVVASPARADIGVRLDRSSARVGDVVTATSARCCFNSLYLVPVRIVPSGRSCRLRNGSSAICAPWSVGPPRRPGWFWLGRFFPQRGTLRFRVPNVRPGLYRAVVYCPPCYKGPRGSLISGDALRVR